MAQLDVNELVAAIKDSDDKVRAAAWTGAGKYGAAAVKPLANVMTDNRMEVARAAKRGLWKVVRYVGRPGADQEREQVEVELCGLLHGDRPDAVTREVLWMLSEIGGDTTIEAIREVTDIMGRTGIRDDARSTIQRIPGDFAITTLEEALDFAPDDFKMNLVQALRKRGVKISEEDYPCQKLVPTKKTKVKPVGR
jgi:ribosomal protein S28E/S33